MKKNLQLENFWKFYLDPEKEDKESATEFLEKAGINVKEEKEKVMSYLNKEEEEEIDYRVRIDDCRLLIEE